jgi:hypothetical protein
VFWGGFNENQASGDRLKRHPEAIEMSKPEMFLASCINILRNVYGFNASVEAGFATDAKGNPLPLYTYPTIEYLVQFDLKDKTVFEFGAGASTLFWQERAKQVVSVENNQDWYQRLKPKLKTNATLLLATGDAFPWAIESLPQQFDIIVIDGAGYRYDCAVAALTKLAAGGMVILDNADWHPNTAAVLKQAGLLQVDMTGFKPCECHTSTTSVFFKRDFAFNTISNRQPEYGKGAKLIHSVDWDKPYAKR